jgi:hypothetical protein
MESNAIACPAQRLFECDHHGQRNRLALSVRRVCSNLKGLDFGGDMRYNFSGDDRCISAWLQSSIPPMTFCGAPFFCSQIENRPTKRFRDVPVGSDDIAASFIASAAPTENAGSAEAEVLTTHSMSSVISLSDHSGSDDLALIEP